jgi:beta-galactosidase
MKSIQIFAISACILTMFNVVSATDVSIRSRDLFNSDWRFARFGRMPDGSQKLEPGTPNGDNTTSSLGQVTESPSAVDYDDTTWRGLAVPHDWGIEGPFRDDLEGDTGKLPWQGIGWYRKHFVIPSEDRGKRIFIDFDGAMANAEIWLNGKYVGTWPYGYNSFELELTSAIKFGAKNVLAVRLDTERWGSRWYPGAGIYRNVWLVKTAPVHVGHWGVYITTPSISPKRGDAKLVVTIDNQGGQAAKVSVKTEIYEIKPNGVTGKKVAASSAIEHGIAANASSNIDLDVSIMNPKLWDVESPSRYLSRTIVSVDGRVVDAYDQPFGFRTIEFTARDGFKLNGRRVELQGTCNHHDLGPLGAAFNTRAMERQLEILKEMGDNALRTSHNPPRARAS